MKNLTEIVFILDRSGSMSGMEQDTIGGYNAFLQKQKEVEGDALVSTILFSNDSVVLHDRVPIGEVKPITEEDYFTCGCTALLDAIGGAVHHISKVHKYIRAEDVPEKTIFVITTDGLENASRKYSSEDVKSLISKMKEEKGWEFLFVAEDINAVETAASMGISSDRAAYYEAKQDTGRMFCTMSACVANIRACEEIDPGWKRRLREKGVIEPDVVKPDAHEQERERRRKKLAADQVAAKKKAEAKKKAAAKKQNATGNKDNK